MPLGGSIGTREMSLKIGNTLRIRSRQVSGKAYFPAFLSVLGNLGRLDGRRMGGKKAGSANLNLNLVPSFASAPATASLIGAFNPIKGESINRPLGLPSRSKCACNGTNVQT